MEPGGTIRPSCASTTAGGQGGADPDRGTARIDNHKYKETFHVKAKMIPFDEVEARIGHAPGGVCPFGIRDGVDVYLDESLRKYDTVYPAAGNDHSAVRLTIPELEKAAGAMGWVDVCEQEPAAE
ncbi:MAG: YbaK/EbsC family protein [Lachnospiraceae bacterium]